MREQIKRILGLVAAGRLSAEDAAPLLAALHPKLGAIKPDSLARLFGLLDAEDFGPDRIADLLMQRLEPEAAQGRAQQSQFQSGGGQQSQSQQSRPATASQPSATFKIGGMSYPLDGLGEAISSQVEAALGGFLGRSSGRPARPGTILRIETDDAHGASFSANLPLSLAAHAERLIPPHALAALERSGMSIDALKLLLQAGPPPGPLLEASDEHGNSLELSIK